MGSNQNYIQSITVPTGMQYIVTYGALTDVEYEGYDNSPSDAKTSVVESIPYVKNLQVKFYNQYIEDKSTDYTSDNSAYNYAGNYIYCPNSVLDNLKPYQDWMLECSFANPSQNYNYTNTISSSQDIFNGTSKILTPSTVKELEQFDQLSLLIQSDIYIDNNHYMSETNTYDPSNYKATSFDDLVYSYDNPTSNQKILYQGSKKLPLLSQYEYDDKGNLIQNIDSSGNKTTLQYMDYSSNHILQRVPTEIDQHLYDSDNVIKTTNSYQAMDSKSNNNVSSYKLNLLSSQSYLNDHLLMSSDATIDNQGNSVLYSQPSITAVESSGGGKTVSTNSINSSNDQYISQSVTSVDDQSSNAPNKKVSEQKIYNQYGNLVETVDPISLNKTLYTYNDVNNITKVVFEPAGIAANAITYDYSYSIINDSSNNSTDLNSGYSVVITKRTPSNSVGMQEKIYYDSLGDITKNTY